MRTQRDASQPCLLYSALNRFISKTVLLSVEEERTLALNKSAEARDRLILSHLPLVKSIAFNFNGCGIDVKDLFNVEGTSCYVIFSQTEWFSLHSVSAC